MRKILFIGIAAVVAVAGLVFLVPQDSPAAPVITWTPGSVAETISPGASKTINVSFVSSEDLRDVEVRVVPELGPFVKVTPTNSLILLRGDAQSLTLEMNIPEKAQLGQVLGTIHLVVGRRTVATPLKVAISIGNIVIDTASCYQMRYYDDLNLAPLNSRRPKFISGKYLSSAIDGLHISVLVYDNSAREEIEQWYQNNLADKEYSFPEFNRVTELLTVNGLQALRVYSRYEGDHHLRYYIGNGNVVYSVETTTSDEVDVPWQFFQMLDSFTTICSF